MAAPALDFWFDFASTYSYLTAMRITPLAEKASVRVRFRPFLLGAIFQAQGWTTSPFNLYPAKGRNMWRDLEPHDHRRRIVLGQRSARARAALGERRGRAELVPGFRFEIPEADLRHAVQEFQIGGTKHRAASVSRHAPCTASPRKCCARRSERWKRQGPP